jgi:uncharacterized protein YfaS (alpha-2-macroglobulin family)
MENTTPLFKSRRLKFTLALVIIVIIAGAVTLLKKRHKIENDPAVNKYIESYTAGMISKTGTIRVKLAGDVQTSHAKNEALDNGVFDLSPSVKGKAYWLDERTIEFKPEADLEPNKKYEVDFNVAKVTPVSGSAHFKFDFATFKPDYTIGFNGLQSATNTSLDKMKLTGIIQMADKEDPAKVEKMLTVGYPSQVLVTWQHNAANNTHKFVIDNIIRTPAEQKLEVHWDGSVLDIDGKDGKVYEVPAIGDFKVMEIKAVQDHDQYIEVHFSNPLKIGQELNGLTGLKNMPDMAYTIDGSLVKMYAPEHLQNYYYAFANEGVQDIAGKKTTQQFNANVFFENRLPTVSIPGKGVILPGNGKLMMPFEAANLTAVDVSIIKVYESNVSQFLQNNDMNGETQLRQVAKPVVQTTIRLDGDKTLNLTKTNRFMLDIDHILHAEPGAIYRVMIGFRKAYSLYNCKAGGEKITLKSRSNDDEEGDGEDGYSSDKIDEDDAFWQRYNAYYPDGYNWKDRDNACSKSYYTKDKWASRNIIASNIGLIAKRGNDNNMLVAVTNIMDAAPMTGVTLELLDYQKQVILSTTSDANGFANFNLKRKPYLLVAKKGSERGYLKLDDGNALMLSKFDVGGEQIQNGLKGFIYGERGVWRPGDSIFVSFILEDKLHNLPAGHPVTFEFFNPMGQLYRRIIQTASVDGFYSFHTATTTSSPTGNWLAKVKVGGASFEKNIKIETVMPNRLKIDLSFGGQAALTKGGGANGTLKAQWLFGGIANSLKAKVDAFLSQQSTHFKGYDGYTFDDPTLSFNTQTQTVFDGRLNEIGSAPIDANINVDKQAPGQLRANFVVKVFEPGGAFSIHQLALPYNVYKGYVGVKTPQGSDFSGMLPVDRDNSIDIADVDVNGNALPGTRSVQVELYKIQWRWWWDKSDDDVSNFTQNQFNKLITTQEVNLTNGKGKWNLHVAQNDWGRYLIKIKDPLTGHSTGKIVYVDWAERLQQTNSTDAVMLSFTSNKKAYKVGEEATLTIPTSNDGRALISFESGSKIIKSVWIDTHQGQTQYKFTVESSMAPNVFVNVTLLQHHEQTVNDLPIRMYGVIALEVNDPATILKPVITMPDKIKPETPSSITVSEASGKEMTYTIALVDEGLLDLTSYKTPNPHTTFYAREALGVKTWDLFDYVIGAYGGGLERILGIGGDGAINNNKNVSVNRFKPVVKFMGPYHLNKGERQNHRFTLPQYIGSIKAMVIAGHDGSYGSAEKVVAVKKPLMILATLPRVLGPTEKVRLPVTVFAMESNIKTVDVEVQSNAFSNLGGANKKSVTFNSVGDQLVTFELDVKNFIGVGKVRIIARSGNESAAYDVEMNIRNPNPPITRTLEKELKPGEVWNTNYVPAGMVGINKAMLEVSSIPALNLAKRLGYLVQYPHGCVEQTTSAAFPQLYLNQLVELTPRQVSESERNIKMAISKLNGFQVPGGGLSYWPGDKDADEWGTNYAGHFMLSAQAKGYSLPVGFLDAWKKYQKQKALNWVPDTRNFYGADLVQAYRLYLLALAHAAELGAMNRLKEFKYLSPEAKWRLAAAYKLAGQPETGLQMIVGLSTEVKPYNQMYGTYGSDVRDKAMILETLTLLGQRPRARALLQTVAASLATDDWYSTQTTAYSLLAIAEYCGDNKAGAKLTFNYQSGKAKASVSSGAYVWQTALAADGGQVVFQNKGSNVLYVRLIQQGQPAPGQESAAANHPDVLTMGVIYMNLKGQPVDVASLKQGTDFVAQVMIKNTGGRGKYDNMALTQIFPSGWEILNSRMLNNDEVYKSSASDYRDVRDDRVNTYFGINENQTVTYYVMLNAAYTGRFYMPAVYCEAMYNSSINALQKGRWVEVVK